MTWGSGCSYVDIEDKVKVQYKVKHGSNFLQIKAWKILKESPKFFDPNGVIRGSKKAKVSASGEYIVSSNTESEVGDEGGEEPLCPMGRNAARRIGKGKGKATASVAESDRALEKRLKNLEEQLKIKNEGITKIARHKDYKILMKDTSNMTEDQLRIHLHAVDLIKKEWGL